MNSVVFALITVVSCLASLNAQAYVDKPVMDLKPVTSLEIPSFLGRWFMMYASKMERDTFFQNAFCVVEDLMLANDIPVTSFVPTNLVNIDVDLAFNLGSPTGQLKEFEGTAINNNFLTQPGKFNLNLMANPDNRQQMLPNLNLGGGMQQEFWILAVGDIEASAPGAGGAGIVPPAGGLPIDPKIDPKAAPVDPKIAPKRRLQGLGAQQPLVPGAGSGVANLINLNQYPWAIVSDATGSKLFIFVRDVMLFQQKYEQIVMQKLQSLGFTGADATPVKIEHSPQCMYPMIEDME